MSAAAPRAVTIRAYNVGFGDCLLLSFDYRTRERHVLIDFGTKGKPKNSEPDLFRTIAEDIRARSGGKLDAVVATHRHQDHVSGFATNASGTGPGDVIAACDPEAVIQPWTEDPDAARDAVRPTRVSSLRKAFVARLGEMHACAEGVLAEATRMAGTSKSLAAELSFVGDDNLQNLSAVKNLQRMGRKHFYVHYGSQSGFAGLLPGVKVDVLGPPTLEQTETIRSERDKDVDEFWHLQAQAARTFARGAQKLFRGAAVYAVDPPHTRWLKKRLGSVRGSELLEIVRALDEALNNTSVILLFTVGQTKLLFPGDAQIENWAYALKGKHKAQVEKKLAGVSLYKVGHHGSLNATPKSMWELFENRSPTPGEGRLRTICSTMGNKYGSANSGTEVPRKKLIDELKAKSDYVTTQDVRSKKKPYCEVEVVFGGS